MYNDLFILAAANNWSGSALCLALIASGLVPMVARIRASHDDRQTSPILMAATHATSQIDVKPAMCSECGRRLNSNQGGRLPSMKVCAHCQRLLQALVD